MTIEENLKNIKANIPSHVKLVAVSKTYPSVVILKAYHTGHKIFGENRVQELVKKHEELPNDIEWHLIGHLQSNKVKYISSFVNLIHSVDSLKLLEEINKCALRSNRVIDCLLQIHIASEETKFGLSIEEATTILSSEEIKQLKNIRIKGLMGMATLTEDENQIRKEFKTLKKNFDRQAALNPQLSILSMGMSSDYKIAIEEGSNLIRVGSLIFGERHSTINSNK
ncbi:MAG TPA: YggS family pyridoxal phosphate-dependent enzyme [Bacteroidia bacterium]